jgi:hypothetical protein
MTQAAQTASVRLQSIGGCPSAASRAFALLNGLDVRNGVWPRVAESGEGCDAWMMM